MPRVASCDPRAEGVKTTEITQDAAAARVVEQLLVAENWLLDAPVMFVPMLVSGVPPELVRVTVSAAEETPRAVLGKVRAVVERVSVGPEMALPERLAVWVPSESTRVRAPE